MDHSKLVVVDRFASQAEADLAKSILESASIDAAIQADRAGGMRDHLAWSGFGFKILVREEDFATAHELLQPRAESEMVVVQSFGTQAEADHACDALVSAGVPAIVEDTSPIDLQSIVPKVSGFRLLAPREDVQQAADILRRMHESSNS